MRLYPSWRCPPLCYPSRPLLASELGSEQEGLEEFTEEICELLPLPCPRFLELELSPARFPSLPWGRKVIASTPNVGPYWILLHLAIGRESMISGKSARGDGWEWDFPSKGRLLVGECASSVVWKYRGSASHQSKSPRPIKWVTCDVIEAWHRDAEPHIFPWQPSLLPWQQSPLPWQRRPEWLPF